MTRVARVVLVAAVLGGIALLAACEQTAEAKVQVEKLPDVKPSLPPVPTIPPPPHPVQYDDQSYSVYGLRWHMRRTIDTDVTVTGYIAKVYVPPECPPKEAKEKCPTPPAPHIWLADVKGETDETKHLIVADYAESQKAIDDAVASEKKGKPQDPAELAEMGMMPIPTDLFEGAKLKVKGRFAYVSGGGFQSSEGVLGYAGHETLEPGTPPPEEK